MTKTLPPINVCGETYTGLRLAKAGYYNTGFPALHVVTSTGGPFCVLTVNLPGSMDLLDEDENRFFVKNWSANEGIYRELIRLGVLKDTGIAVTSGFVQVPICSVSEEYL